MIISGTIDEIINQLLDLDQNNYVCFYTPDVVEYALKLNEYTNIQIAEIQINISIQDIINEINKYDTVHSYLWNILDILYNKYINHFIIFITNNRIPIFINHYYNHDGILLKIDNIIDNNIVYTPRAYCNYILNINIDHKMYLLHYKITNKSFFLSEYLEYLNYYGKYINYHIDTDYFFSSLNELKAMNYIYHEINNNITIDKPLDIPKNIIYYRSNSYYKNYYSYEDIDSNTKLIDLNIKLCNKPMRRLEFDIANNEADPYMYYMNNILNLHSQSLQQKSFKQLLQSIQKYITDRTPIIIPKYIFNIGLEIFINEISADLYLNNNNFYYKNTILFFYVSDNFLSKIKNYCRANNITECYIASIKLYNIKFIKIRKTKTKNKLVVEY